MPSDVAPVMGVRNWLCGAGVRAGSRRPLGHFWDPGVLFGAHGSGRTTSRARCWPVGALWSRRTVSLALLGWARCGESRVWGAGLGHSSS